MCYRPPSLFLLPRLEKMIIEVDIYGIVSDLDALHGCAVQLVPLDFNGKPVFFGDNDSIFFNPFPMDIVESPEKEGHVFFTFFHLMIYLIYFLKTLENKIDKIAHVRLLKPLTCRRL